MTASDQRRAPRRAVELPCLLVRRRGNPVRATTQDIGAGGMRVVTDRPLAMDEWLEFDLAPDAPHHPRGRALVVRQQTPTCYALRFDEAIDGILDWVGTVRA